MIRIASTLWLAPETASSLQASLILISLCSPGSVGSLCLCCSHWRLPAHSSVCRPQVVGLFASVGWEQQVGGRTDKGLTTGCVSPDTWHPFLRDLIPDCCFPMAFIWLPQHPAVLKSAVTFAQRPLPPHTHYHHHTRLLFLMAPCCCCFDCSSSFLSLSSSLSFSSLLLSLSLFLFLLLLFVLIENYNDTFICIFLSYDMFVYF